MLKARWDRLCDTLWFIDVPRDVRLERAKARGWDKAQFAAREAAQESVEEKRRLCDVVIDNSGAPQQTMRQLRRHWQELVAVKSMEEESQPEKK